MTRPLLRPTELSTGSLDKHSNCVSWTVLYMVTVHLEMSKSCMLQRKMMKNTIFSHVSGMALRMVVWVHIWTLDHFVPDRNISVLTIGWITIKWNSWFPEENQYGNPGSPSTIMRLTSVVLSEMSPQLLNGLPWNFVKTFISHLGWIVVTLVIL